VRAVKLRYHEVLRAGVSPFAFSLQFSWAAGELNGSGLFDLIGKSSMEEGHRKPVGIPAHYPERRYQGDRRG